MFGHSSECRCYLHNIGMFRFFYTVLIMSVNWIDFFCIVHIKYFDWNKILSFFQSSSRFCSQLAVLPNFLQVFSPNGMLN